MSDVPAPPAGSVPRKKKISVFAWVLVGVVVLIIISAISSALGGSKSFTGSVVSYQAVDTKHLQVVIDITNTGSKAGKGQCTVEGHNPFGDFGFDIFSSTEDIQPGTTFRGNGYITIQNEGAESVNSVIVKDCGAA